MSLLACCLAAGLLAGAGDADPLRDEDIVRMLVGGTPVEQLIDRVRSSPVDFDLSDEMLLELRQAGVPQKLIDAMGERQRELHPPEPEPVPAVETAPAGPRLRIRLNPAKKTEEDPPRPVLRLLDAAPPEAVRTLRLRPDEQTFTDLAVALMCRTATHVPDHWRNETPLGRDFNSAPRHRLLAFIAGATKTEAGKLKQTLSKLALAPGEREGAKELSVLELELPEQIEVEVEAGVAHDLTLGIAVQAGGRYLLVAQDSLSEVVVGDGDRVLEARLASPGLDPARLRVRLVEEADGQD